MDLITVSIPFPALALLSSDPWIPAGPGPRLLARSSLAKESQCTRLQRRAAEGTELRRASQLASGQERQRKRPDTIPPGHRHSILGNPHYHSRRERARPGKQPGTPRRPRPPACARGRGTKLAVRARARPHGRAAMPRAPRNVPRTPLAACCSNARPPRCHYASLLLPRCCSRLLLLRPPPLAPRSAPRRWETAVMAPRWKSGDGRRRLLLLLCCCLLAFPCHAQVTNVSHRSDQGIHSFVGTYGINYGRIADNLPAPEDVVRLLKLARIRNVKIYDADHKVLDAFRGSGLNLVVAIPNEFLKDMAANPSKAMDWLNENVQPYYPSTRIVGITVGNEVLGGGDAGLAEALVGAVANVHDALRMLRLDRRIELSTPHSEAVFANSYPPSACVFRDDLMVYLRPLLDFFSKTGAPFYVNAYPFLAYMSDPSHIDINYALFKPNAGIVDPKTGLRYDNMFEAQLDAAYFALEAAGYPGMEVRVAETGWASAGDATEAGAGMVNAVTYNRNLRKRLFLRKGTPYRPEWVAKAYIFALFNENLKPGPTTERHYGLFKPDGSVSINIGLKGLVPSSAPPLPLMAFKRVRAWGWFVQYSAALLPCTLIFLALAT